RADGKPVEREPDDEGSHHDRAGAKRTLPKRCDDRHRLSPLVARVGVRMRASTATITKSAVARALAYPMSSSEKAASKMYLMRMSVLPTGPPPVMTWITSKLSNRMPRRVMIVTRKVTGRTLGQTMCRRRCQVLAP